MCCSSWLTPWLITCISHALVGAFCMGYNIPLFNVPQSTIRRTASEYDHIDSYMWGAVNAMYPFGALFGALFAGRYADKYGRKKMIAFIDLVHIIASFLVATSYFYAQLLFGRFVTGIGSGAVTVICAAYLNEISPPQYRGRIGCLLQCMITFMIFVSTTLGKLYQNDPMWRYGACIPGILCFIQLLFYKTILPSPQWLQSKGMDFKANTVKAKLWSNSTYDNVMIDDGDNNEFEDSKDIVDEIYENAKKSEHLHSYKFVLCCAVFLNMYSQLSGINGVFYYSQEILYENDIDNEWLNPWLGSVYIGFANFISATAVIFVIDKWGRKPLLIASSIGMAISCVFITVSFYYDSNAGVIVCLMMFVVTFEIGLGPCTFLYVPELCPIEWRAKVMSYALAVNWSFNTVIALTTAWIMQELGNLGFVPFGIVLIIGGIVVSKYFPETKFVARSDRTSIVEFGKAS